VNVSIGTIFSIYKKQSAPSQPLTEKDFLQKGRQQVAGGYILYGPSTMLVFTTGMGVNGFTYESTLGEYVLSHPSMQCNEDGKIFSINDGLTYDLVDQGIKDYLHECREQRMTGRYIGSLVADFHRNLLKGGVFLYPPTTQYPNGKLRLTFEANALAFIAEQAGGLAKTHNENILDIQPTSIHQRVPLYIGSKKMVARIQEKLRQ
jgi:fructose-1,6-bisphosphatase I